MKRVVLLALAVALMLTAPAFAKNSWAQQQQQLLLLQQQQLQQQQQGGMTEAQREQQVRDAYAQQANAMAAAQQKAQQQHAQSAVRPRGPIADISGPWSSEWGTTNFNLSPNPDGTYTVTGTWDQGIGKVGVITSGKYLPNSRRVSLVYSMPWKNMMGNAELTLDSSNLQMHGKWRQPDGSGTWNLSRAGGHQISWLDQHFGHNRGPSRFHGLLKDISGNWNSNLGPVQFDLDPDFGGTYRVHGTWMQGPAGQRIRIREGQYRATPTPQLTFEYSLPWGHQRGSATLTPNAAGTELRGTYSQPGMPAGTWVLSRPAGFIPSNL